MASTCRKPASRRNASIVSRDCKPRAPLSWVLPSRRTVTSSCANHLRCFHERLATDSFHSRARTNSRSRSGSESKTSSNVAAGAEGTRQREHRQKREREVRRAQPRPLAEHQREGEKDREGGDQVAAQPHEVLGAHRGQPE